MKDIQQLEEDYLKAKVAYYEGEPLMSDSAFDSLEEYLKKNGSKVIEQVGSKRKDFDFPHPTKMLSLSKIQTEKKEDTTNYMEEDFMKWYKQRSSIVGDQLLSASPKFDGNAINVIYRGKKLTTILTRGDGLTGKDVTSRLKSKFPEIIEVTNLDINETDTLEIRCEVVIDIKLFNSKYSESFSNARNYVAGVIGKDDTDIERTDELTVMPLHYILNGKHVGHRPFSKNKVFHNVYSSVMHHYDFVETIKLYENIRKDYTYQLDGVVISFPEDVRERLGENEHDPAWAVAIKFVPAEAKTEVVDIEWNVSKRGEIIPTVLLKPVFLDGTTVKRAAGYNVGNVIEKGLGSGAIVTIAKAGDIVPEIRTVIVPNYSVHSVPIYCPVCQTMTEMNGVHLLCPNKLCKGKVVKQLFNSVRVLDIKGIGEKTIEAFADDFESMLELIIWARVEGDSDERIEKYGIKFGSRSHEIFINAFKNIKSLTYEQVIQILGYDNVGDKLSTQIAREHAGLDFDYSHLEKTLVTKLRSQMAFEKIKSVVDTLENIGITIHRPKKLDDVNSTFVCLTGSPKDAGYKTKEEFIDKFKGLVEVAINDKRCKFLITDSYSSTSSKMKEASKRGIAIKTYSDFNL